MMGWENLGERFLDPCVQCVLHTVGFTKTRAYFTNIFPIISGTVVTIEGPRFSTRAESFMFRSWKADVINMTTVPEVVLAKELGAYFILNDIETDYQNL